jgi:hypothetical protein
MGNQGYRSNYFAAFESANHQLEYIYSEYHDLQRRKEKLEGVLAALEPFLQSVSNFNQEGYAAEPARQELEPTYAEPTYAEQYSAPQPVSELVVRAERFESSAPPAFAPAEQELDPLQLRINRALGLAVA